MDTVETESRAFSIAFEDNPQPMWVFCPVTLCFLAVNRAAVAHYGWSREQFLAMSLEDVRPPADREALRRLFEAAGDLLHERCLTHPSRHLRADGSLIEVEITGHPVVFRGRRARLAIIHDVTARGAAERALARRSRLYALLSGANQLLLRASGERELFQGICRIAVENGGLDAAWIGVAGADGQFVEVARSGAEGTCLGPLAACLSTSADYALLPCGDHAALALPLRCGGRLAGGLVLCASEPGFFGPEELATLREIVGDVSFGLDVLERNRQLQAATQVVEASPVLLFRRRPEPGWPVEFVSNNVARWGYAAEDFLGGTRAYGSLLHPADCARVAAEVEEHLAAGASGFVQEYRIVAADGRVHWVEDATAVERAPDGAVRRLQGTVADVTERHAAREALERSEAFARGTLDSLAAHVAIVDAEGVIVAVNAAWRRFAAANGADPAAACEGASYLDACRTAAPDGQGGGAEFAAGLRAVMEGRCEEFSVEYPCHSPQEQRWFIGRVTAFAGGSHGVAVVAHQDITARKLAELRLAASEANLARAQRIAHLGSWEVDVATGDIAYSAETWRLLGTSADPGPQLAPDYLLRIPVEDRERVAVAWAALLADGPAMRVEHRFVLHDGTERWLQVNAEAVRDEVGRPTRVVGTVLDVSDRRRAEEKIRSQLLELQRWQRVTLGREERVMALKAEVNALLREAGRPERYGRAATTELRDRVDARAASAAPGALRPAAGARAP